MSTTPSVRTIDQLISLIRDGGQPRYLLFWGHHPPAGGGVGKGCLSQWWPAAFTIDGLAYATAEHFMMTSKAMLFGDAETAERIRTAPHPGAAKTLGRRCADSMSGYGLSGALMWWSPRWPEMRCDWVSCSPMAAVAGRTRPRVQPKLDHEHDDGERNR